MDVGRSAFFSSWHFSPLARAKAPELPQELLPRETLEKIYKAELPHYNAADYDKLYAAHVYLEKYFLTDSAEDRQAITKILDKSGIPLPRLGGCAGSISRGPRFRPGRRTSMSGLVRTMCNISWAFQPTTIVPRRGRW